MLQLGKIEKSEKNSKKFIEVPQKRIAISYDAFSEEFYGHSFDNFNKFLRYGHSELFMPRIDQFMQHYVNVLNSAEGKGKLYYADGSEVPQENVFELWTRFNTLCRTSLDANFEKVKDDKGNDKWIYTTDHRFAAGNIHFETMKDDFTNNLGIQGVGGYFSLDSFNLEDYNGLPRIEGKLGNGKSNGEKIFFQPLSKTLNLGTKCNAFFSSNNRFRFSSPILVLGGDTDYSNETVGSLVCFRRW